MKKLMVIIIVVLLGIFLLNIMQMQMNAKIYPEQTIGLIFGRFNENFQKMTIAEKTLLVNRCGEKDISDASTLIQLWGALLRVTTESVNIISER